MEIRESFVAGKHCAAVSQDAEMRRMFLPGHSWKAKGCLCVYTQGPPCYGLQALLFQVVCLQ